MKNKIVRFSIITAACLLVWGLTIFVHFKNAKIPDFLQGFSLGMGSIAAIALIYHIVIALKQKKAVQ